MLHDGVRDRRRSHGLRRGGKPSILPVPSGTLRLIGLLSPLRAAFHAFSRLGHCPCRPKPADYPLAEAFRLRDAEAPQLGAGISNKICAAFRPGISNVPTGTSDVNGVKWLLVVDEARLTPEEIVNFLIWLEDAHGAEIAARSQPLSCPPVRWSFRH